MAKNKQHDLLAVQVSSLNQARDEFPQKALDFRRILERVARGSWPQLFRYDYPNAALLKHSESVFIGAIIADVNWKHFRLFQAQCFQQPDHGLAFVPIDIG